MFITEKELNTHLYNESVQAIARGDSAIALAAIDAAVVEAKGYLGAYDVKAVFEAEDKSRHPLLLVFVKDIAVWHFINLCNAGVEMELRKLRYERAVAWLKSVQKGDVNPDLPANTVNGQDSGALILSRSNPKRKQHF